jgi:predicted  nucleic acid-binding Zn-ribbon protein
MDIRFKSLSFLLLANIFLLIIIGGCSNSKEETRKEARQVVDNAKDAASKYENWVLNKAEFSSPVVEQQNIGFQAKIDTALTKWETNKEQYKKVLEPAEFSKFDEELQLVKSQKASAAEAFKKKFEEAQKSNRMPIIKDEEDETVG